MTLVNGAGWEAYARLLHPEYSRWAMGEAREGREAFVHNLRNWWEHGMRVDSRETEMIGVDVAGDVAIVRYRIQERLTGPDDAAGSFAGYITNVWLRANGDSSLLSAEMAAAGPP